MAHRLLGAIDLFCIVPLLFPNSIGLTISLFCAMYLILKGGVFLMRRDLVSTLDVFIGIYILLNIVGIYHIIPTIVGVVFLVQKGIFSFMH